MINNIEINEVFNGILTICIEVDLEAYETSEINEMSDKQLLELAKADIKKHIKS